VDARAVSGPTERTRSLIIERRDGETKERLVDRFRLMVQRAGLLREVKRRRHFVSKSEVRRRDRAKALRRARRNAERSSRHRSNGRQAPSKERQ